MLVLGACSRSPESPESPAGDPSASIAAAASAALAATITPEVAAAVSAGAEPAIAWREPHGQAEVEAAFAEAQKLGQPVFVYWGAVWCPPCNQVRATVFNRPDFIAKSRGFVAIYLDGDQPGAQKLGARFKVRGYPTMILFRPDGSELTRLPGEVDAQKYLQVLALGLGAARPVRQVLAQAQSAPTKLSADDWRLLAYYAWDTDEQQLVGKHSLAPTLRRLAAACPPAQAEAATRLALQALLAEAGEEGKANAKVPRNHAAAREKLLTVLADDALARQNLDIVTNYAQELSGLLTAPGTPEREQLASVWAATLDRLTADARLSQGDRMAALVSRIALARLGAPKDAPLSAVLQEHVRLQTARADREVASDIERQAVMTSAAHALSQAGLLGDSDRLLNAELKRSHSPYYAMLQLAANAGQRGDKGAALGWYERAYKESRGPATRVQWGASYVSALVELAPEDAARIAQAAASVLGELKDQPDAFYDRTARSLERMSGKLLAWSHGAERAAVLGRLRAQRDGLCTALPANDAQRATCEGLFVAPARLPAGARSATHT